MSASGEMADNSNTNQSVVSDGLDDSDSKGASGNGSSHGSNHGTRLTRSRANQGTPGPNDQGNDSPSKNYIIFGGYLGLGLDLTTVIQKGLAETEVVMAAIMEHD